MSSSNGFQPLNGIAKVKLVLDRVQYMKGRVYKGLSGMKWLQQQ